MTRRTAFKILLLIAPAVLISGLLGLWGRDLRAWAYDLFSRKGVVYPIGLHRLDAPDDTWKEPVRVFIEQFADRFARDNPFQKARLPLKPLHHELLIVLTGDTKKFQKEAFGETGGPLPFSGGYFNSVKAKIIIDVTGCTPRSIGRSLSHELTHAIMHYSYPAGPEWSPWLAEGVAQWAETDDAERQLGAKKVETLKGIRPLKPGSLRELINADDGRFKGRENRVAYDQAYALVAFLLDSPDLRDKFLAYFDEETAPGRATSEHLFRREIGELDQIEHRWSRWLQDQN